MSQAELRLSTSVAATDDDGTAVTVATRSGDRLRARHALVAVPVNTLAEVAIPPAPAPAAQAMVHAGHPMRTSKIYVRVGGAVQPFVMSAPFGAHPMNTARVEYRHDGDSLVVCSCSDSR